MSEGTTPLQTSGDNNLKQVTGEDQQKKKKGALARIKDSLKAVPTKIKSGMNTLASKITSPFKRKKGPDTTTDNNKLEDGSSKPQKKPGLFSRTKTRVADMGRAIAKALSPTKNKSVKKETTEKKETTDHYFLQGNEYGTLNDWSEYLKGHDAYGNDAGKQDKPLMKPAADMGADKLMSRYAREDDDEEEVVHQGDERMADLDHNPNIMADFAPSANTDDQLGNGSTGDEQENGRQQTSV